MQTVKKYKILLPGPIEANPSKITSQITTLVKIQNHITSILDDLNKQMYLIKTQCPF